MSSISGLRSEISWCEGEIAHKNDQLGFWEEKYAMLKKCMINAVDTNIMRKAALRKFSLQINDHIEKPFVKGPEELLGNKFSAAYGGLEEAQRLIEINMKTLVREIDSLRERIHQCYVEIAHIEEQRRIAAAKKRNSQSTQEK